MNAARWACVCVCVCMFLCVHTHLVGTKGGYEHSALGGAHTGWTQILKSQCASMFTIDGLVCSQLQIV